MVASSAGGKDPIDALIGIVQGISVRPEDVRGGCPLNNLAQEMFPLDAGFRKRLPIVFDAWREAIASFCARGRPTEAFAARWNR